MAPGCRPGLLLLAAAVLRAAAVTLQQQLAGHASHHWPHVRGSVGHYSATPHSAPANLTASLSWSWHHPEGRYSTVVVSGPLIDDQKNIYISSEDGVRKFSADGRALWYYAPRGPVSTCPSLMSGSLFGSTQTGWLFALDLATGSELWAERKAADAPADAGCVEAHDGVVVAGVDAAVGGGAGRVLGLDADSGRTLWEYTPAHALRNLMAVFPGDGSFMVMDVRGGVAKHALHNATLLWKTEPPAAAAVSLSDGGVMLGPDGTAYACSSYGGGQEGERGVLRAYRRDGALRWQRALDRPCEARPGVTPDGRWVVAPAGAKVGGPAAADVALLWRFGRSARSMRELSLSLGNAELKAYGRKDKTAAVQAFDARTGEPQWSTELPPYGRLAARGDEEGYLVRQKRRRRHYCLPSQLSAPTISGDGTIYVGRADGHLYAVESGTGQYRTFDTKAGFLHHGTSWAPGMMAVASCDGLFVWSY